jgi:nucleoside-diphosphate-sugar epimerase
MGGQARAVTDTERLRPERSEVQRLWCDNSLIRSLTGFEPQYALEDGLRRTVEWFAEPGNLARYKPDIYNV